MSKKLNGRGGRFVLLAAALLFAWGLRADTATVDGYTYTYSVTDGKATIGTGETVKTAVSPKPTGRLTVPSELGGYPVTGLGESAFYNCTGLTDVTIPNGVTHIGPRAFSCCSGLENVTIGSGVTSIEPYVFPSCVNLRNIAVDPANTAYMSQDGMLLTKDGTTLVYGVGGDVEIPSGVATIGTSAFFGRKLKSIRFSGSVTNIGSWAFGFCHDLDMSIPNAILKIGDYAFVECRNLNLWLPRRFEGNLNSSVFKQCSNLTVNYYDQVPVVAFRAEEGVVEQRECLPGTKVGSLPPAPTHERYAFEGWWTAADGEQATAETVVTNDVTYYAKWRGTAAVGDYTYTYSVLNGQAEIGASNAWKRAISPSPTGHVTVPSSLGGFPVVGIGDYAFYGLYSAHYKLESVTIPNGVTRIGKRAFSGCPNLTEVTIPASMAVVDDGAFSGCSNLKGVHISNLVNWCQITFVYSSNPLRQAHELYLNGERVTRLVIPEGVTSIGDDAFAGCSGLTEVTFPNSVTNIGNSSFMDCSGLMELVLPGSVAKIGIWAFRGCSGLTEVEIPHGVKVIGGGVFLDCSNLTKITVDPGNENYVSQKGLLLTKDGKTLMEGVNGVVVIPSSVTRINNFAFSGRDSLTQVTIPNGIREIGWFAFSGCDSLTKVVIPSSVVNIEPRAFVSSGLTSIAVEEGNEFYSSRNGMLLSKDGTLLIQGVNGEVEFPPCVRMIGEMAFMECSGLTRLVIPDSVTNIASKAFAYYRGLTDAWLPRHLEGKFSANVFEDCGNMTLHYYDRAYTVTFQTEEGIVEQRQCPAGMSFDTLPPSPSRDGYAFEGWWTAVDGEQASEATVVTNSVTYYAKWRGTATVDDYTYTYSVLNGQAEIGSSNTRKAVSPEPTGHVAVPSSLGGFPVVGIGKYAFYNCYELEGVTIPEGVTAIGKYAFDVCSKLEGVTIPEGVAAIGEGAFSNCPKLDSVTIPESVTAIGQYAFQWCDGLKSVHISNLTAWCQIKFDYYANPLRQAHELYLNGERVTKLIFPEGLKAVGTEAFAGCSGLTEVTIPDGVTIIGNRAFSGCSGLTEVTIPNGVTAIGNAAFSGCSGLTEVTLPNGVTTIGDSAFSGCRGLTEVEIPHGVKIIDVGVFAGCSGLTKITVDPKNVNYMSQNGLLLTKDGKTLKEGVNGEVVIPPGVTMIGYRAFADRDRLTKVTIPAGVEVIGWEVFYGCDGLVDVAIPGSVTDIGLRAFAICSRLMNISVDPGNKVYSSRNGMLLTKDGTTLIQGVNGEVEFPSCVRMIGTQAFEGCSGLTRLVIPDNVTNIASRAFAYYRGLTDVMIPDDIQFVGDDAFGNCGRLANVTIPICLVERSSGYFGSEPRAGNVFNSTGIENATLAEGATTIGSYALAWTFNDKTVPAHVTIPNSVTSICNGAFWYCPGLKSVAIPESVVSIGRDAFYDCGGLTEVTIPNSVTNIEAEAFPHCTSLGSVTVPACVLDIGLSDVFSGTTSITNVVLAEGVQNVAHDALGTYPTQFHYRLKHVFIPASVTNIDVEVFRTFQGKVAVTVDPANAVYSSWNGMLLTKDGTRLLQGVSGDVTIPPGVTSIDAYAFYGCSLTSLTIPSSVTSIGERAFYNCSNLTDLTIPDSVTDIGGSAFGNCRNLRNVWLPKHLEGKLGSTVFANCGNATLNYYDALYCVTFRTEEGIVEQRQCPSGMKVGALPPTPTYAGYAFEGWWTAADGEQARTWTVVSGDVTYHAKWRGTAAVGDYSYTYSVLNGQAEIGKGESSWEAAVSPKPTGDVVIPSTLDGYPVTGIGRYAFYGFGPTSFEIPEGVVDIRKFAFRYSSLTNVVIPSSVTNIHVWAFEFCDRQVNFTVDPANAVYSSRNGLLLSKDGRTLVRGVNGKVVIPSCVTEIGGSAFEGCRGLRSVVIPDGVLGIGTNAFQYCQALKNMAIPQSVTNIGTRAFTGCSSMENFSVDMANGFYTSWEGMLLTKDAEILIRGNTGNDGEVVIPDGVKVIDEFAFDDLFGLEYVTIPSSVTTIGDSAFEECWNLTQINIPNSVKTIGTRVFCRCMSLTNVSLPNSLTTIGRDTFADCRSLTSIEIPRGVTEIKYDAFHGCTGLVSRVVIPDSVTNIEWNAFARCKGLKEVWLPRSIEERFYPDSVFWGCDEALVLNYYDTPLHTVVFRSDEGADKWRLCPAGVTLGELPQLSSRAGAVFAGWWTVDGERVSAETVVMGDMTLEARWHVVAAPEIVSDTGITFWNRCYVEIMCADTDAVIYYSTDGQIPHLTEAYRYKGEFWIDRTTTIRAIAVLDGVRSACVTATFERECSMPQYRDGSYDDDAVELTFTTGGDADWDYTWTQSGSKYSDYEECLRSGQIGDEQESWLQTSVVGRGTFSFRWKVDCEYDDFGEAAWDHLAVFTNGVEAVRMDGTRGWERMSFTFDDDGRHTIRWVFVKDGYDEEDAAYEDCAWLGRFSWNPADVAVDTGKGRTVTVPGTWLGKRTMRAATDMAANGRKVWECYLLGCDPEKAADDFRIASFEVVDGVPAFTFSHTRDGSGVSFEPRIRILGKARLDDAAWTEMPEGGDPALRFFKAEVALP